MLEVKSIVCARCNEPWSISRRRYTCSSTAETRAEPMIFFLCMPGHSDLIGPETAVQMIVVGGTPRHCVIIEAPSDAATSMSHTGRHCLIFARGDIGSVGRFWIVMGVKVAKKLTNEQAPSHKLSDAGLKADAAKCTQARAFGVTHPKFVKMLLVSPVSAFPITGRCINIV